jgi:hypothetical protein
VACKQLAAADTIASVLLLDARDCHIRGPDSTSWMDGAKPQELETDAVLTVGEILPWGSTGTYNTMTQTLVIAVTCTRSINMLINIVGTVASYCATVLMSTSTSTVLQVYFFMPEKAVYQQV